MSQKKKGNIKMENKKMIKNLFAAIVMVMAICYTGITAHAYGLTQTGLTQNSITIKWDAESQAEGYYYLGIGTDYRSAEAQAESKKIKVPVNTTSYTFTGLSAGTEYYVYVNYEYTWYGDVYMDTAAYGSELVTKPSKVTGVKQTKWWYYIKSVDFAWNKQPAAQYEYVVKNNKGKKIYSYTTYSNSGGCSKSIKNNAIYTVKVRAYVTSNNKKYYGDWSDAAYLFTQPMVKKASISGSKLKVSWGKISGTTGYDIYVSTKEKSGYKKVKSVSKSKSSVTISKLKGKKFNKKKKYYVYIVAKKKVGKKTYTSGRHYTYEVKNRTLNWTFD